MTSDQRDRVGEAARTAPRSSSTGARSSASVAPPNAADRKPGSVTPTWTAARNRFGSSLSSATTRPRRPLSASARAWLSRSETSAISAAAKTPPMRTKRTAPGRSTRRVPFTGRRPSPSSAWPVVHGPQDRHHAIPPRRPHAPTTATSRLRAHRPEDAARVARAVPRPAEPAVDDGPAGLHPRRRRPLRDPGDAGRLARRHRVGVRRRGGRRRRARRATPARSRCATRASGRAELAYGSHPWVRGRGRDGARAAAAAHLGVRGARARDGHLVGQPRQLGLAQGRLAARLHLRGRAAAVAAAARASSSTPGSARCSPATRCTPPPAGTTSRG